MVVEEVEKEVREAGMDGSAAEGAAPGVQEVKEHNLSFILESTLISDVYFSCSGSNRSATMAKSPTSTSV